MAERITARAAYEGTGGWNDGRFGQAYDLIADALKDRGVEIRRHKLLEAIELEDGNFDPGYDLPDGLRYHDGEIQFECRSCGSWTEWPASVADFEPGASENRCGGSPRCIP